MTTPAAEHASGAVLGLAAAAAALGATAMAGWLTGADLLTTFHRGFAPMKIESALGAIAGAASLWLQRRRPSLAGALLALPLALAGAAVLTLQLAGRELQLERVLLEQPGVAPTRPPAPGAPLTFIFIGLGLALLEARRPAARRLGQVMAVFGTVLALVFLTGFAYGATGLRTIPQLANISLPTSLALFALGAGCLAARPAFGVMRPFTADTASAIIARRLVVPVVVIPFAFGWLRLYGQQRGLYGTEVGVTLYALANMLALSAVIWWSARALLQLELGKRGAEEALAEREEDLETTLQSIGDAVLATDTAGAVSRLNAAAERVTGWRQAEARGKPLHEVLRVEGDEAEGLVARVLGGAAEAPREGVLIGRDGSRRTVARGAAPIRGARGEVRGVVVVCRDVSEEVAAARRLRLLADMSQEFAMTTTDLRGTLDLVARRLTEVVGDACVVRLVSEDGAWLDDREATWYGRDPARAELLRELTASGPQRIGEGISGRVAATGEAAFLPTVRVADIAAHLPPERHELLDRLAVSSLLIVPMRSRDRVLGVVILVRHGGSYSDDDRRLAQDLADRAALTVENGRLMAALSRRVEELQRAEGELRTMLELAPDAMVIARDDGVIETVNARAETIFERPRAELIGQTLGALLPGYRLPPGDAPLELAGVTSAGDSFPAEILVSPLDTREGRRLTVAIRDLTERRRLEDFRRRAYELEAENRKIEEANRTKSQLLATMSHELRTPLNAIIGFSAHIATGKPGPLTGDQREFLEDILRSSRHLLQLVNDVLDLAKVESGKMEMQVEDVDLELLVAEVKDILRGLCAEKRLEMVTSIDPQVSKVRGDPRRLKQVLYNYLSNAIKFTPERGKVELRVEPGPAGMFSIEVEDSGVGIKAEDMKRLFLEFQQLDPAAARDYPGSGLGLALTKRIVEAQGGRVSARSAPGHGSTFSAVLPRVTQVKEAG